MSVSINGVEYEGKHIRVVNGVITVDGQQVGTTEATTLVIQGNVGNIETDLTVNCRTVSGNVKAGGSVNCDDVEGDVHAGGSVNCDDVWGHVNAGGSVRVNKQGSKFQ